MAEQGTAMKVVYHYTSMEALLKIVSSQSFHATNINFLNDVTERRLFFDELDKHLRAIQKRRSAQRKLLEQAYGIGSNALALSEYPFVTSFSEDPDSLPQWRAYCPQGNGVAIGVRSVSLQLALIKNREDVTNIEDQKPSTLFAPVQYLRPDDRKELVRLLKQSMVHAQQSNLQSKPIPKLLSDELERRASLIKHKSFEAEREHRLVVNYAYLSERLAYRSSRSTLIPFIPVTVPDPDGYFPVLGRKEPYRANDPYFIESVVVGPTPSMALSTRSLQEYFLSRARPVQIVASSVPYRDTI